jgi:hypothetical protein
MPPIELTFVSEKLYSRTPERGGGYLEITERKFIDQYGHEWHSFHSRLVFDEPETKLRDNPSGDNPSKE